MIVFAIDDCYLRRALREKLESIYLTVCFGISLIVSKYFELSEENNWSFNLAVVQIYVPGRPLGETLESFCTVSESEYFLFWERKGGTTV